MPTVRGSLGAMLAACLLSACTIVAMRQDNEQSEQRVRAKELELQQQTQAQAQLQAERQRLVDDLKTRELTIEELKARLQQLQQLNSDALASTQEQQRRKATADKQLSEAARRIDGVQRDPTLTPEAKARRLNELRNELRRTLELLANT